MSAELSAYAAYSKKEQPKKTKTSKRATIAKSNGANGVKRQNGVRSVKKGKVSNTGKMCSRSDSSSCGSCGDSGSEEYSSEQACGMDSTEQTFESDEGDSDDDGGCCGDSDGSENDSDSSTDYYSDKDDDEDGSGSDGGSDDDNDNGSDDDDGSDDDVGSDSSNNESAVRSDQFSEEYTPNSSGTSGSSIKLPTPSPSPPLAPVQRKAAQKRRNVEVTADLNNNNNDDDKPTTAKQQRQKAPSCPLPPRAKADKEKPTAEKQQRQKAPSYPLPPRAKTAAARPSSTSAVVKSCPLPPKTTKVATGPKSCPLPRRSEPVATKKQQDAAAAPRRILRNEALAEAEPKREVHLQNSIERGKRVLLWLLHPVTPEAFFSQYWERNACQVQRKRSQYFSQFCSFKMIDEMLIHNHLEFTTNIDVTSYVMGERQTHNPDGRAMPPTVWGYYGEGCSIRILNPSTYLSGLRQVCTVMQEYFHCLVGANVYLTPPNSQGFAPHYDDIEAFVLQVEGRKRWRLYAPPLPSDMLARHSSGNYKQEQLGEAIFDAVLEPGDILYFPRGTVHQAVTEKGQHSLHITLSVYQQQSYANLIEKLMPTVMENAIKHHLSLRRGLPLHTWHHLGLAHGGQQTEKRKKLVGEVTRLVQQYLVPTETQIDAAVDQLAKRFQHEALPPVVLPEEKCRTVFGSRSQTDRNGHCLADYELTDQTMVRLLRANVLRLVAEENSLRVYYYVDNALEYCKYEANFMEIQPAEAAAVESLIKAYPNYLKISTLPLRSADRRVEVATALWERGLLMTEKPFK